MPSSDLTCQMQIQVSHLFSELLFTLWNDDSRPRQLFLPCRLLVLYHSGITVTTKPNPRHLLTLFQVYMSCLPSQQPCEERLLSTPFYRYGNSNTKIKLFDDQGDSARIEENWCSQPTCPTPEFMLLTSKVCRIYVVDN